MATVKVNFALREETIAKLNRLVEATFRDKSDVIDWAIDAMYKTEISQPAAIEPAGDCPSCQVTQ